MQGNTSNSSGSVVSEFLQIIKDLSSHLKTRKQNGHTFLPVSDDSQTMMKKWGRALPSRSSFLFEGSEDTAVFMVDSEGSFFKGEEGQLLVKILGAMNLSIDQVFICNIEDPDAVHAKIKEIKPKIIIALGEKASHSLLETQTGLDQLRGKFHEYNGIKVMPTFHPSRLLKHPENKREVWEDMKQVMAHAGLAR